jgi:hypothetical protein
MPKDILVIALGGMMDAKLHAKHENLIELKKKSQVPQALRDLKLNQHCKFIDLIKIDRKTIDIPETLRKAIEFCNVSKILITCEKALIPTLAKALPEKLNDKTATIIFVTANTPLANGTLGLAKSDGFENLKMAIETLRQIPPQEQKITTQIIQNGKILPTSTLQYDKKQNKLYYMEKIDHSAVKSYAERAKTQMSKL